MNIVKKYVGKGKRKTTIGMEREQTTLEYEKANASPFEIGSSILNTLQISSPNILPSTPVTIITATVIVT